MKLGKFFLFLFSIELSSTLYLQTACGQNCDVTPPGLANDFAPQLMLSHGEPNLPANVDWFLPHTHLAFENQNCQGDDKDFGPASIDLLQTSTVVSKCGGHTFRATGTRNANRSDTFLLTDVNDTDKRGLSNPSGWTTYYHTYKNTRGGWTIQYWSFYAFNTGKKIGPIEVGYHGGDWEMVSVVLDANDQPLELRATGHTELQTFQWSSVQKNGTHPIIFVESGGHEMHATPQDSPPYILYETWKNGLVVFPNSPPQPGGNLTDLGTKLHPKVGFLDYAGLWGSIGETPFSSGYWGPPFNETGMPQNGFFAAWCDGIANPTESFAGQRECFADDVQ